MSLLERSIEKTPIAVLDFETTGLSARNGARVIEVAVVRVEPGEAPRLVLDTLVDPEEPVSATRIHGITDDDVLGAPTFADLSGTIAKSVEGAVVACFNASFDMQFWNFEYDRLPESFYVDEPPHVCLMYLKPLLGLGKRCCLDVACAEVGLSGATHRAADDALVSAYLWLSYREIASKNGLRTFNDIATRGTYQFCDSLAMPPLREEGSPYPWRRPSPTALKPRFEESTFRSPGWPWPQPTTERVQVVPGLELSGDPAHVSFGRIAIGRRLYWQALVNALTDGWVDASEVTNLRRIKDLYQLGADDLRALHGRIFGERLLELAKDEALTDAEAKNVASLNAALGQLGWAPGS